MKEESIKAIETAMNNVLDERNKEATRKAWKMCFYIAGGWAVVWSGLVINNRRIERKIRKEEKKNKKAAKA